MTILRVVVTAVVSLLCQAGACYGQTAADASGHWAGILTTPVGDILLEIDLGTNDRGQPIATLSQPAQDLKGFPLVKVAIDGRSVSFDVPGGAGGSFAGELATDGRSIDGNFSNQLGAVGFVFTRTGDARFEPTPRSAPIARELEGTWNGSLDVGGRQLRLVLQMANHPDGTSTGAYTSVDEGGVTIPVTLKPNAQAITIESTITHASYSAVLNTTGTELVGTYSQRGVSLPLTLRRDTR